MTRDNNLDWLITDFVQSVPGVAHAAVVTSDGLPLVVLPDTLSSRPAGASVRAWPSPIPATSAERSEKPLSSRSEGVTSDGSCLSVPAAPDCEMSAVAHR
ncbi:roadblock/LC7 domain-containing protein [Nonomuraea sp. NPDC049784]|uniref:roadblock/LC7 domain-containing protein n=1 Tax=Nonomuraea sp. NPDC049784 TaxID=3154361 RepID=UPI0033E0F760